MRGATPAHSNRSREIFRHLLRRSANRGTIDRLHGEIVAAARNPALFLEYGIDDTFEGRFEAVTLHSVILLRRLKTQPRPGPDMAQDLADAVFRHFDLALREAGVGDISVPKRMKRLAEAFLGREVAYDLALRTGGEDIAAALSRNVYAGHRNASRLARYVEALDAGLANASLEALLTDPIPFPEPSAIA